MTRDELLRRSPAYAAPAFIAIRFRASIALPGSTLLVRMEDVVLRLHDRVARVSTVGEAFGIGGELVRCGIVVEHRVSPPASFRKSVGVLLHDESLTKDVWHIHGELSFGTLL